MVNLFPFKVNGNFCLLSLEAKKQVGVSKFVGGRCSAELGLFFKLNFDGAIELSSRLAELEQRNKLMKQDCGRKQVPLLLSLLQT